MKLFFCFVPNNIEAGATFISIKSSTIFNKWFGESDKLASALFSLGRKLAPSVIFIDEIETLLRKRGESGGNAAMQSMQVCVSACVCTHCCVGVTIIERIGAKYEWYHSLFVLTVCVCSGCISVRVGRSD